MALPLYIPPCIHPLPHPSHPPPLSKSIRIQIDGPLVAIQKLLPEAVWYTELLTLKFPQPAGVELAKLAYQAIYECIPRPEVNGDLVIRDEYLGWLMDPPRQ
jgi:hypothetical protein